MDILSFVLGIGAVVLITGNIVAIVSFVKVNNQRTELEGLKESMSRRVDEFEFSISRQFENEHRDRESIVHEIYRTIDSRLDKLENKLKGEKP